MNSAIQSNAVVESGMSDNYTTERKETKDKMIDSNSKSKCASQENQVTGKKKARKKLQENEALQRLNYLYQASHFAAASCPNRPSIAAYYGNLLFGVARKTVLKLAPCVKRTVCKGCQCLLLPGVTARVRLRSRPSHCVLWTCTLCQTQRRFNAKCGYQLWTEKKEAVVP